MSAVEQQQSPIRALVSAALQAGPDSPEIDLQIDAALSSSLDDPLSDNFIGLDSGPSKNQSAVSPSSEAIHGSRR